MLKRIELEAKNQEDALNIASKELRISKDKLKLEIIKEKKGLLKKSFIYAIYPNINLGLEGKAYLETILQNLNIDAKMDFKEINEDEFSFVIDSEENALLIGREGRNLKSIQYLLRNYLGIYTDKMVKLTVDIGNYNENRKKQLEILATKTAKEVVKTRIPVKLDPMNAFERRIIHTKLTEWTDIITESEGEEPARYLIIKPKR